MSRIGVYPPADKETPRRLNQIAPFGTTFPITMYNDNKF